MAESTDNVEAISWSELCSACKGYLDQRHSFDRTCLYETARKVCSKCEQLAEFSDHNKYGNLGGWLYTDGRWICRDCER